VATTRAKPAATAWSGVVRLALGRETKNMVRYEAAPDTGVPEVLTTVYLAKSALPTPYPAAVTVTVAVSAE
jgi:hypothetical protein